MASGGIRASPALRERRIMPLIVINSPKGGVGKTTLTAHIAAILAKRDQQVLALDLDPQNSLRLHLGLSIRDEAGYANALDHQPRWQTSVVDSPAGVRLLPFGSSELRRVLEVDMALLNRPDLLTTPVREILTDPTVFLIVDTPPGPSPALTALTTLADLMVVVLVADIASAALIPPILSGQVYGRGTMSVRSVDRMVVLMNQVDLDAPVSAAVLESARNAFGPRLLGAICWDSALADALGHRRLLTNGAGGAAEDLQLLVDSLMARTRHAAAAPAPETGVFSALKEWGLR
jgi:cellulose synthase operon protein YhjQ